MAAAVAVDPVDRAVSADVGRAVPDPAASAAGIICLPPDRPDLTMAVDGTGPTAMAAAAAVCCRLSVLQR